MMPCMAQRRSSVGPLFAAALFSGAAIFGGCTTDDDPGEALVVTDVSWAPSEAGRVEVRFTVENPSEGSRDIDCDVHAFDADGFDAGRDKLSGDTILGTLAVEALGGDANVETYRTVTGIDADDVSDVQVEC